MKKLRIGLSAMLLVSCCYAGEKSWQMAPLSGVFGSFLLDMPDGNGKATLGIDVSEAVKSFNLLLQSAGSNNKVAFGLLSKEDGYRRTFALRGKYSFRFNMLERGNVAFVNEGDLVLGVLDGAYLIRTGGDRFKFAQMIFGLRDEFVARVSVGNSQFGARIGADVSAARLSDSYGSETAWDSFSARYGVFAESQLAENVSFRVNADGWRKKYNPNKYFFVEKWASEARISAETSFSLSDRVDLIPLFGYRRFDLERDRRTDLERLEYGGRLVYKTNSRADTKLFFNGIYAPWQHKSGSENLISAGVESKGLSAEVFRRQIKDSYSTFEIKERIIGARLAWKFGGVGQKNMDSYGKTVKEKYDFYRDSGIDDNTSLTLKQQAERLRTIRKRNEWSGNNLVYKTATDYGWGFRYADEAYSGRAGDCDEQSCLNVTMDALNGYKGYTAAWWDFKSWMGHGAAIVQDPTNGQWFFDEYGTIYKVKVSPNASLAEAAKAAIRQNHMYSALPISDSADVYYAVIDCSDGKNYEWLTRLLPLGPLDSVERRPNVERGMELFIGRNFLFND